MADYENIKDDIRNRRYSRQEIKDFFDEMHKDSEKGISCNIDTLRCMMNQDPNYWVELESEYRISKIGKDVAVKPKPPEPPIGVRCVKDGIPSHERKPIDYKLLILIGVYLCGVVSGLLVGLRID